MGEDSSAGARFRDALQAEQPLQIVGTVNAYAALLAEHSGFRALYLSGGGVAAASHGLPDLGVTTREDVLTDLRRLVGASALPVLVDADTGWGNALGIARTVREMLRAGAAALHIEDQVTAKRCGHRPGKAIVPQQEMVDRIKAAVDARSDEHFVIMARTDAVAVEGRDAAIERAMACVDAGADMVFPEAITELDDYRRFADAVGVPVLANITEFGRTPLFTVTELGDAGVAAVLYPLSAFRAMSKAALQVYRGIREHGTQDSMLELMQSRDALYQHLGYHAQERRIDDDLDEERSR